MSDFTTENTEGMEFGDGGPAFPHLRKFVGPNTYEPLAEGGMSLRDWFAGQALAGLLANPLVFEGLSGAGLSKIQERELVAKTCGYLADAMLRERSRKEGAK